MKTIEIADLFCGAGGTSAGAVEAIQRMGHRASLTAINHWPVAVATHSANHPEARHLCASLDALNPRDLYREGQLDLLWASPECTHHSIARGGRPMKDQSRATAWCVVRWAEALRPGVILVENVPEFMGWGPLGANGRPLVKRKGEVFRAWLEALRSMGYRVDHRILCAADHGDPTTRRRLFIQAVRGRRSICWPSPTHAEAAKVRDLFGDMRPWIPARDIIDWTLPSQSIYDRKRPLSPKTMARIEAGLRKFGGKAFQVSLRGTSGHACESTARSLDEPVPTLTSGGGHNALVQPFLVHTAHSGERQPRSVGDPAPTITGNRGDMALIQPFLIHMENGGSLRDIEQPMNTITTAKGGAHALVQPFLVSYYGNGGPRTIGNPLDTVTANDRFGLVQPTVNVDGQKHRLDIAFRMLQPHELAGAQGFPEGYHFEGNKTEQVKQIGNAVPRHLARAIVAAAVSQNSDVGWLWEKTGEAAA